MPFYIKDLSIVFHHPKSIVFHHSRIIIFFLPLLTDRIQKHRWNTMRTSDCSKTQIFQANISSWWSKITIKKGKRCMMYELPVRRLCCVGSREVACIKVRKRRGNTWSQKELNLMPESGYSAASMQQGKGVLFTNMCFLFRFKTRGYSLYWLSRFRFTYFFIKPYKHLSQVARWLAELCDIISHVQMK